MLFLIVLFCFIFLGGFFMGFSIGKYEGNRNILKIPFTSYRKITYKEIQEALKRINKRNIK